MHVASICFKCFKLFQMYVSSVSSGCCITCIFQAYVFKCFGCFIGMLQVFHLDVAKVDLDVVYVDIAIRIFQEYV
jgi:hypothetical protein